jgi:hypothetical protein
VPRRAPRRMKQVVVRMPSHWQDVIVEEAQRMEVSTAHYISGGGVAPRLPGAGGARNHPRRGRPLRPRAPRRSVRGAGEGRAGERGSGLRMRG